MALWWLYGLCISSSGATRKFDILSQIWPWRSRSIVPQNIKHLNQGILHLWSKFAYPSFHAWLQWGMSYGAEKLKWGKFRLLSWIWPWRSRSINPPNNTDLNQGLLHLRSKFGDPSLKGSWVIARTSWGLRHTPGHTQTDAGNQGLSQPKIFTHRQWPFLKPNKAYRPTAPKKG